MKSGMQAWRYVFHLGVVMGLFYGCFVIGVLSFERQWLGQPGLSIGAMATIIATWAIVVPLAVSLLIAAGRALLKGTTPPVAL